MLADVIYCCKITSVMVLKGVSSFLRLKDIKNACLQTKATQSNY